MFGKEKIDVVQAVRRHLNGCLPSSVPETVVIQTLAPLFDKEEVILGIEECIRVGSVIRLRTSVKGDTPRYSLRRATEE